MKYFFLIIICLFSHYLNLNARDSSEVLFALRQDNNQVVFQFVNEKIFNQSIRERIEKGVIVGVEHHIRLWEDRRIIDNMVAEKIIRIKIEYDHWENAYYIQTSKGDSCIVNSLNNHPPCLRLKSDLIDTLHLKKETIYFASVETILHPISLDNFREFNQWLQSEVTGFDPQKIKNVNTTGRSISEWFLKMLMNVSGFADKVSRMRSDRFVWQNAQMIWLEE